MKRKEKRAEQTEPMVQGYDYSTPEAREETVAALFARARDARTVTEAEWEKYNDYYNFIHTVSGEIRESVEEADVPWLPAVMPDPWITVESQIDPRVPEPEFRGRDTDTDSKKAKQREYAVKYIVENNRLEDMNTRNERRLLKYGDAFWKAYWDTEMRCGTSEGDIRIRDIPIDSIYPDPAIRDGTIQDGQYLCYVYRLHKVRFCQMFRRDLERLELRPEELFSDEYQTKSGIFDMTTAIDETDDTVQVLEHWFRQPEETTDQDGNKVPAGAVGCSIQAGGRELRYIANYWKRTCRQNQLFPFVHYWRVQDENTIWNKSELFPIMGMVDAADRKLAMAILADAFTANDIIVLEEGALADGEELTNEPGAVVRTKQGRVNGVRRLGGNQPLSTAAVGIEWFKSQIERSTRNYETTQGKEPTRTTTASGLAMIRQDADTQTSIKKADRNKGFERLYELLDWLALEFFDDDRIIFLGAKDDDEQESVSFSFNADKLSEVMPPIRDLQGNVVRESWTYWPKVDVTITAEDRVVKGKQATLEALQILTQQNVTAENWKLFAAQLEILDVPGKQDIIEEWRSRFEAPQIPPMQGAGMPAGPAQTSGGIPGGGMSPLGMGV